jgi:indolepyruvate ferredoxin oxidoreductase
MERTLVRDYEALVESILGQLSAANHAAAVALAACHDAVRGFDVVKEKNVAEVAARVAKARSAFEAASRGESRPSRALEIAS